METLKRNNMPMRIKNMYYYWAAGNMGELVICWECYRIMRGESPRIDRKILQAWEVEGRFWSEYFGVNNA